MAKIGQYAELADAIYSKNDSSELNGWKRQEFEEGSFFGNGFQGAVFSNSREVVVAFKGTKLGGKTGGQDAVADLKLVGHQVPTQARAALSMLGKAQQVAGNRPISIVGHSLGGALAQLVGARSNVPFVTFNAPGALMAATQRAAVSFVGSLASALPGGKIGTAFGAAVGGSIGTFFAKKKRDKEGGPGMGLNFRVKKDPISQYGHHVGSMVELEYPGKAFWLTKKRKAHGMGTVKKALEDSDWRHIDPFIDSPR